MVARARVTVWDPARSVAILDWLADDFVLRAAAWNGGGRVRVAGSPPFSREVRAWDAGAAPPRSLLHEKVQDFAAVALTPSGDLVAVASNRGTTAIVDIVTLAGDKSRVSLENAPAVGALAFSPDARMLAVGALGKTKIGEEYFENSGSVVLYLRNSHGWQYYEPLISERSDVTALTFSADGRLLASGHRSGRVRLWDVESRKRLATFHGHEGRVRRLAFSADQTRLASGGDEGGGDISPLRLWDVPQASAHVLRERGENSLGISALWPRGTAWILEKSQGLPVAVSLGIEPLTTSGTAHLIRLPVTREAFAVAAAAPFAAVASRAGQESAAMHRVHLPDARSEPASPTLTYPFRFVSGKYREVWNPLRIAISDDGEVIAWQQAGGIGVRSFGASGWHSTLPLPDDKGWNVALSGDGYTLAAWSGKRLLIQDRHPDRRVEALMIPVSVEIESAVLSRDGRSIATVQAQQPVETHNDRGRTDSSRRILVTNLVTAERRVLLIGGTHMHALAFSPDGTRLVASVDDQLVLWGIDGEDEWMRLEMPPLRQVIFSPDGRSLLGLGGAGEVVLLGERGPGFKGAAEPRAAP